LIQRKQGQEIKQNRYTGIHKSKLKMTMTMLTTKIETNVGPRPTIPNSIIAPHAIKPGASRVFKEID
jgi:hypothetical protein